MKVKEVDRTANIAWSPQTQVPSHRDGDRVVVVDHMGDSLAVRLERKLEMRAGHKR